MLQYKGSFKSVNEKPLNDEWIEIFASDWLKEYWAFYGYISLKNHKQDLADINELIHRLNWRDGDVYVELIDHSNGLKDFYHKLYEGGHYTHHNALELENWQNLEVLRDEKEKLPETLGELMDASKKPSNNKRMKRWRARVHE